MILIYAFSNPWGTNISRRTLLELQKLISTPEIDYQIIYGHPRQFYQKYIRHNHYSLMIGLGDYGQQADRIRIETTAHNRYGQNTIFPFAPFELELSLPVLDLVDPSVFSIGTHMGTYNCNWIAFQIQLEINQHLHSARQLFFHLPPKAKSADMASAVTNLLRNNGMLK